MTPPSLSFHLSLFLICLPFLSPSSYSILGLSLLPTVQKIPKPKGCLPLYLWQYKTHQTAALQPGLTPFSLSLSLSGCFSFNTVTHSRKQPEYKSDSWARQELWCGSEATERAYFAVPHWREFPLFKALGREIAPLNRQKWMMSWLTVCVRKDLIHRGSQNESTFLVNVFQFRLKGCCEIEGFV